jgi:catechol 2,3-dioxygenase-like lactoylglutathione lyase family enzyme
MFKDSKLASSFAVKDPATARQFYEGTLGLDVRDAMEAGLFELHGTGGTPILVYPKPDHVPAVFTVLNIMVPDIDTAVDGLISAGVGMEHYDSDDLKTDARGIARDGRGPAIAWFKDPSGNIVSVLQMPS